MILKYCWKMIMMFVTTIETIQTLLIEIFKIKKGFAPPIVEPILKEWNNTYKVRSFQEFETERKKLSILVYKQISAITASPARTHEAT